MADQPKENHLQAADSSAIYREALDRVWNELQELKEQKKELAVREVQLNESLKALMPLAGAWKTNINEYSLSNAVRFIFNGLAPDRTLSAIEVRAKLEDLGYDLSDFENPLASIHTCVRRMIDSEELIVTKTEDNKKEFQPGPELKSVPEPTPPIVAGLQTLSDILAKVSSTDEKK
jgi:hypothetical protein